MTGIIIVEPDEPVESPAIEAVEALTEVVQELAETVAELAEPEPEPVPVVVVEQPSELAPVVVDTAVKVAALEEAVIGLQIEALEPDPVIIDEEPETEPTPDVPPSSWKTKFNRAWFGGE